ncbi:MAG: ATP-binding protein [Pseudomonadota bacterium]
MPSNSPVLHLVSGKMASGKSTLAAKLAQNDGTVLIAEDAWLGELFSDQMSTLADYVRFSAKLRGIIKPHVVALLRAGVSVSLDFPANTADTRVWMRDIIEATGVSHQMHVMDVSDETCLARLRQRNATGDHPFAPTEEQFHRVSAHYTLPSPEEGFKLVSHRDPG